MIMIAQAKEVAERDAITTRSFTQEMSWVHTWFGLVFGWVLVPIFVLGTICVFWFEISFWARPESHGMQQASRGDIVAFSEDYLSRVAPDSRLWKIILPESDFRDPVLTLGWLDKGGKAQKALFLPDGKWTPVRTHTIGGRFFVNFHYTLDVLPRDRYPIGMLLVGAASIAFLASLVSGVVIHKRIFKDFFTFRPKLKSRQRKWLDAHNVLAVVPLPFHFMIVLTGLFYLCYAYVPSGLATFYGGSEDAFRVSAAFSKNSGFADLTTTRPGPKQSGVPMRSLLAAAQARFGPEFPANITVRDHGRTNAVVEIFAGHNHGIFISNTTRVAFAGASGRILRVIDKRPPVSTTWDSIAGLHMVFFGGALMRLLYFACGAAGSAMMAIGLVKYTVKRREKTPSPSAERFFNIVDRINLTVIVGVLFACAGHLWAIRLLPYAMPDRIFWEVACFWICWGLALAHAALRPPRVAWIEQYAATALLCLGLPVLGFLVPNSSLVEMVAVGDWKTAGVDLSCLIAGVIFAWVAWSIHKRPIVETKPRARRPVDGLALVLN